MRINLGLRVLMQYMQYCQYWLYALQVICISLLILVTLLATTKPVSVSTGLNVYRSYCAFLRVGVSVYKQALIHKIQLVMQSQISPEKIDLQKSFKACSKVNYIPNNNFNNPAAYKHALTPEIDREGINCGFSMGRGRVKQSVV